MRRPHRIEVKCLNDVRHCNHSTEPTVENPQIAVPPGLLESAEECRTRVTRVVVCGHRTIADVKSLESNGCKLEISRRKMADYADIILRIILSIGDLSKT